QETGRFGRNHTRFSAGARALAMRLSRSAHEPRPTEGPPRLTDPGRGRELAGRAPELLPGAFLASGSPGDHRPGRRLVVTRPSCTLRREALRKESARVRLDDVADRLLAPRTDWSEMRETEHFVQFYETEGFLVDAVMGYIGTALRAGEAGIVFATGAHRARLEERLQASGLDVAAARASGRDLALDAAATLS